MTATSRRDGVAAAALAAAIFLVYNANGREIASYDSQPTRLAARALLVRGTLALNHDVGAVPALLERPGFILTQDGNYRSAYSPVPAIVAASLTWPLWKARIIDPRAPRAPAAMAKLAASLCTAAAVGFLFLAARRGVSRGRAAVLALAVGLGTGFWPTVSQTLWQHETAVLGFAIAVLAFGAPRDRLAWHSAAAIGIGLGLAGSSRPQVAAAIAVLLAGTWVRGGVRTGALATAIVAAFAIPILFYNMRWFGTPLGGAAALERLHQSVHGTRTSIRIGLDGLIGILVSPNRGLLVFSPVVLVAVAGIRRAIADGWESPLRWCGLAALAQYFVYGSYAVWWGGHTYGPRYLLDVLPLLVPLGAEAMAHRRGPVALSLASAALAWSVIVAATGAFCYPNDRWNVEPDVDRRHERLWDWTDTQIARCWRNGASPQNFLLFSRDAVRVPGG